jgi:hypothetical protein
MPSRQSRGSGPSQSRGKPVIIVHPYFNRICWSVIALCGVSLLGMVIMSLSIQNMSPAQQQVLATLDRTFFTTGGALIGLLGGLAGVPRQPDGSSAAAASGS